MNKQIFVGLLICAFVAATYAACTDRKEGENRDFIDEAQCKLSSASDKVKETFSSAISSDTVQDSYAYVKNKTSSAADTVNDAAKKTGSFLSDLGTSIWDSTKKTYERAKDAINGKKDNQEIVSLNRKDDEVTVNLDKKENDEVVIAIVTTEKIVVHNST